jgi:hypothetical protein
MPGVSAANKVMHGIRAAGAKAFLFMTIVLMMILGFRGRPAPA